MKEKTSSQENQKAVDMLVEYCKIRGEGIAAFDVKKAVAKGRFESIPLDVPLSG